MNYHEQLKRVAEHVALFYLEHIDDRLLYHNQLHITNMVDIVKKMAFHYQLSERDYFIVCAAAWFHDTGYLITGAQMHEVKSAELAESFLQNLKINQEDILEIKGCILATQLPQNPVTLLEKIICDADMFNLGTESFKENNKAIKKEAEALTGRKINGTDWRSNTIGMMEKHRYHTEYCQSLLDRKKAENLVDLKKKEQEKLLEKQAEEMTAAKNNEGDIDLISAGEDKIAGNAFKHDNKKDPARNVDTMFKISSNNHQRLSRLADNKAHIMITVNAIIISVVIGTVFGKLEESTQFIIPTIILLVINVITIIFSVLATRPKVAKGTFTPDQVKRKSVNLLFFGSFYKMDFKEYEQGMLHVMNDSEFLYRSLMKDIYWQGHVLGRKFRLLRVAYDVFMYGIAIAVVAYTITAVLF
jgi:predicted metal-dependent HD superfamily phosphohydrolase